MIREKKELTTSTIAERMGLSMIWVKKLWRRYRMGSDCYSARAQETGESGIQAACRWARLEHHVYGQESKTKPGREDVNQSLKDRLECFDDHFPCLEKGCDREHVSDWIRVFRFYHNNVRVNGAIGRAPMALDDYRL